MEKGIDYDYYDITESEEYKNAFYDLRTKYQAYEEILAKGGAFGIPALFYNDEVIIGWNQTKIDEMIEKM